MGFSETVGRVWSLGGNLVDRNIQVLVLRHVKSAKHLLHAYLDFSAARGTEEFGMLLDKLLQCTEGRRFKGLTVLGFTLQKAIPSHKLSGCSRPAACISRCERRIPHSSKSGFDARRALTVQWLC